MNLTKILNLDTKVPYEHGWYAAEWDNIQKYPLLISFPRAGSHWINAVMELYFDRPRLPRIRATFLDHAKDDWMWFHDHDTIAYDKLYIENDEALYLYRDPVDIVFSYLVYQFNQGRSLREGNLNLDELVEAASQHYKNHLLKWLPKAKTVVRNENFKRSPLDEFKKICDHFGEEFIPSRAEWCFSVVTPEELSKRKTEPNSLSDFMLSSQYKDDRTWFTVKYGELINDLVITDELKEWFDESI